MPLDPDAWALLDQLAVAGGKPVEESTVEEARASHALARELAGPPEPVHRIEDRRIPGPAGDIPVRIYTPSGPGPFPALVYFHGGGWVVGNLESVDVPLRSLANRAHCVVVSVDYRLAPEHKFPAAPDDCYAATRWVSEHATELGVDPNRLAVGGDSAGGNLAAVVALMARDQNGPRVAYQLLIYPVTNHDFATTSYVANAEGYLLTRGAMIWFWNHYLATPADGGQPYASPLRAPRLNDLPPARVIVAGFDPLCDEGEAYAARLNDAGVPTDLRRYDGLIHGFFTRAGQIAAARRAVEETAGALRAALSG